jgi:uncharacterized membrane protein
LCLGLFFRCINLDKKVYWVDEVATSLRVAGYTKQEIVTELSQQDIITIADLQKYQKLNSSRDISFTLTALQKSPEHAPLYFSIARFWLEIFGSSILAIRSLSVVFSVLAILALYYLCRELFSCNIAGEVGIVLMSVSPFFVAYAQEARHYSLWTLTIILSSFFLLRSHRTNRRSEWILYTIVSSLAFYTSILSFFVAIAQFIYSSIVLKDRSNILKKFYLSLAIAFGSFLPWIWVMLHNWQKLVDNTGWMRETISLSVMLVISIYNTFVVFIESPISLPPDLLTILRMSIDFFLLIIISIATYFFITKTPNKIWLFILSLAIVTRFLTIAIDLITKGQSSTAPRYIIPFYLALQLLLAYFFSRTMFVGNKQRKWQLIFSIIVSIGIISCSFNLNSSPRYQKNRNFFNPEIAKTVDRSAEPLIVSETKNTLDLISLSYILPPKTKIELNDNLDKNLSSILDRSSYSSDIFLFDPSTELLQKIRLQSNYSIREIDRPKLLNSLEIYLSLWQIDRK